MEQSSFFKERNNNSYSWSRTHRVYSNPGVDLERNRHYSGVDPRLNKSIYGGTKFKHDPQCACRRCTVGSEDSSTCGSLHISEIGGNAKNVGGPLGTQETFSLRNDEMTVCLHLNQKQFGNDEKYFERKLSLPNTYL